MTLFHVRWWLVLLAALTAVLALLLPATPASATPSPAAETRVGAIAFAAPVVVGVHECITAGQRPVRGPSQLQIVVGNCVAAEGGSTVVKYDPGFALGQITSGGRATASQLDEFGAAQGWARSQTAAGPVKYTDPEGVVRITIKRGSDRAPGSGGPHVELRDATGQRVDPYGHPVTRRSPGNHTPIQWDW